MSTYHKNLGRFNLAAHPGAVNALRGIIRLVENATTIQARTLVYSPILKDSPDMVAPGQRFERYSGSGLVAM